jgi:hypothetical protein
MENATPQNINNLPSVDNGAAAAADFGVRLFQMSIEADKNTLISPLSVQKFGKQRSMKQPGKRSTLGSKPTPTA